MLYFDLSTADFETLCRALGLVGFLIYVTAFFCLSIGRLSSTQPLYFMLVLAASSCVLVGLWADFNLSAALIQCFYIMMSAGAIGLRWKRNRALVRQAAFGHHPTAAQPQPMTGRVPSGSERTGALLGPRNTYSMRNIEGTRVSL